MKTTNLFPLLVLWLVATALSGCNSSAPTQVFTLDGATWQEGVPKRLPAAGMALPMPDRDMGGVWQGVAEFWGEVPVKVSLTYTWHMTDAATFLGNTQNLPRVATDSAHREYDAAERQVLSPVIQKAIAAIIEDEDLTTFATDAAEAKFLNEVNVLLARQGATLTSASLALHMGPVLTRAIDVSASIKYLEFQGQKANVPPSWLNPE
jgi:hypothetical protein